MKRTCDEESTKLLKVFYPDGPCGRTYDDLTHSTQCPHDPLPPKKSLEEIEEMLKEHGVE